MSDDLKIIAQLEKQIGEKLSLTPFGIRWEDVGYQLDNDNKITELSLC
jgi:hypothetical protein